MSGGGTNVGGRDQCQGEGPLQRNTLSVQCCPIAFGQCVLVYIVGTHLGTVQGLLTLYHGMVTVIYSLAVLYTRSPAHSLCGTN